MQIKLLPRFSAKNVSVASLSKSSNQRKNCSLTLDLRYFTCLFLLLAFTTAFGQRGRVKMANGTVVSDRGTNLRGAFVSTDYFTDYSLPADGRQKIMNLPTTFGMNAVHVYLEKWDIVPGANVRMADSLVAWTRAANMYLIITIGGGDRNGQFDLAQTKAFWTFYAGRYAKETHVIYEIHNEPDFGCNGNGTSAKEIQVIDMNVEMYNTIRSKAPDTHIILYSNGGLSHTSQIEGIIDGMKAGGVSFTNASIGYHGYYWCVQARDGTVGGVTYDNNTEALALDPLIAKGYNFINTEFERGDTFTGDETKNGQLLKLYEERNMSWLSFFDIFGTTAPTQNSSPAPLNQDFITGVQNIGVTWTPDYGTWPSITPGVSLSPTAATIAVGGIGMLKATVSPFGAGQGITWSSDNTAVATVNNGVVTGMAIGTATITATSTADNTKKATASITVQSPGVSTITDRTDPVFSGTITARGASLKSDPRGNMEKAFDNNPDTYWSDTKRKSWIQFKFDDSEQYAVSKYTITSGTARSKKDLSRDASSPKNWTLYGTNVENGTFPGDYVAVDTRTNMIFHSRNPKQTFTINNTTEYKAYRLRITANNGARNIQVAEIELFSLPQTAVAKTSTEKTLARADGSNLDEGITFNRNVAIYPNPVTDGWITLSLNDSDLNNKLEVSLSDLSGRVVVKDNFISNGISQRFNMGTLQPGVYVIRVIGQNTMSGSKIIVQ